MWIKVINEEHQEVIINLDNITSFTQTTFCNKTPVIMLSCVSGTYYWVFQNIEDCDNAYDKLSYLLTEE